MRDPRWMNFVHGRPFLALALCGAVLFGCAHPAPAVFHQGTAVISGASTAHESARDARRKVFVEAAAITLDHGYRYFEIVGTPNAIRPGADVTIRVFGAGEAGPQKPGVWDAEAIGAGRFPPGSQ